MMVIHRPTKVLEVRTIPERKYNFIQSIHCMILQLLCVGIRHWKLIIFRTTWLVRQSKSVRCSMPLKWSFLTTTLCHILAGTVLMTRWPPGCPTKSTCLGSGEPGGNMEFLSSGKSKTLRRNFCPCPL